MDENQATQRISEEDNRESTPREQPMLYCPLCSERLAQSRCKLVCQKCGYFMSCADYY